jgi:hypothetical protein
MTATFLAIPNPVVPWHLVAVVAVYAAAAFIIGLFNLAGGVLFTPALLMLPGVTPVAAIGTVFISTAPMSLVRLLQLQRYGLIHWKLAMPMVVAAAISGLIGQLVLPHIDAKMIKIIVGGIACVSGIYELRKTMMARQPAKMQFSIAPPLQAESDGIEVEIDCRNTTATRPGVELDGGDDTSRSPAKESKPLVDGGNTTTTLPQLLGTSDVSFDVEVELDGDDDKWRIPAEDIISLVNTTTTLPRLLGTSDVALGAEVDKVVELRGNRDIHGSDVAVHHVAMPPMVMPPVPCGDVSSTTDAPEGQAATWPLFGKAIVVGVLGGFMSSIGGIGGPLVFMPLYLLIMPITDIKVVVGIINPATNSVIVSSVIGAFIWGEPDLGIALIVSVVLIPSVWFGGWVQARVPSASLKPAIASLLAVSGAFVFFELYVVF